MALYRFRVTFEDYDDVSRDIDVKSNQTFEDLHKAIHQSTGYNPEYPSSFYISNDQWMKGEEITFMPNQKRIDRKIPLMEKIKLSSLLMIRTKNSITLLISTGRLISMWN
jgi:hypothetical protein